MHRVAFVVLASCGGNHAASSPPPAGRAPMVVRDTGVGPIDATAKASVEGLRLLLPDYVVKSEYPPGLGPDNNLGPPDIAVYSGGERLLLVLPDEHEKVGRVLVMSPHVEAQIGWRVDGTLTDPSVVGACECMADGLACFAKSGRVGAIIDEDCTGKKQAAAMAGRSAREVYKGVEAGDPAALAALKNRSIRMLVWRPPGRRDGGGHDSDPPPPPPED